jgi:hypothetical protein
MSVLSANIIAATLRMSASDFVAMPFSVVFVSLAVFFVARRLARAIAKRLVLTGRTCKFRQIPAAV